MTTMLKQIKRDEYGGLTLGREARHCGQCLQVLVPTDNDGAVLAETRLEMADDWIFIGLPDVDVTGCFAKVG